MTVATITDWTRARPQPNWLARLFQQPNCPGEVAIVLKGKKGCGKGIFGRWIVKAWGQHGIQISSGNHLVGRFNSHLRDCVVASVLALTPIMPSLRAQRSNLAAADLANDPCRA